MLHFASDENFNNDIVRALRRQQPDLDIVRIQDVGLMAADDPTVLEWAAQVGRILLTHDLKTIPSYAYARVIAKQSFPGVFAVRMQAPTLLVVADILPLATCSHEGEWNDQILYLPL